jgi:hypothetical protein
VSAAEQPPKSEHRPHHNRRVIHATCRTHGVVELAPHVTDQCVLTLTEDEVVAVRDALTEWLR